MDVHTLQSSADRPHFQRCVHIVQDHILYARRHPERLSQISHRMRITTDAALAVCIADQLFEEFTFHLTGD